MAVGETGERPKEAQERMEAAIRAATAQAEAMARKMVADLLGGKLDPRQLAGLLQGMAGGLPCAGGDSPYRVLGLDPAAEDEVVKVAYRTLSRKHHPDRGGSPERMAHINRAYEAIAREREWK